MKYKAIILPLLVFLMFFIALTNAKAWDPPCDMSCTGEWTGEHSKDFVVQTCFGCSVRIFYYERDAECIWGDEYQFHITAIWFLGCWDCDESFEDLTEIGISAFVNWIIDDKLDDGQLSYAQVFLQSCWSPDLFGMHPKMQPCQYQPDCCRYRYTVDKDENGYIIYIDEEIILPAEDCKDDQGVDCFSVCNPNGYYYQMNKDKEEPFDLLNNKVAPNPNEGDLKIEFSGELTGTVKLVVSDNAGNIVYEKSLEKTSEVMEEYLNVNDFSKGMYNFNLYKGEKRVSSGKFIVE